MRFNFLHKFKIDREVLPSLSVSITLHGLLVVGLSGFIGNWGAQEYNADLSAYEKPVAAEVFVELVSSVVQEEKQIVLQPESEKKSVEAEKVDPDPVDEKIEKTSDPVPKKIQQTSKIQNIEQLQKNTVLEKDESIHSDAMTERGISGVESYASRITSQINAHKFYPPQAIKRHEEGDVMISFRIDREGGVHEIRIISSSFSHNLDRSALQSVERSAPFEIPPSYMSDAQLVFKVPLRYRLHSE